jgi:hypothetical protein
MDRVQQYRINWTQRINRMSRNRLTRIIKNYGPKGGRNRGGQLKRLPGVRDRSGPTGDSAGRYLDDDDNDDDGDNDTTKTCWGV